MSEEREYRVSGNGEQREIVFTGWFEPGCEALFNFFESSINSGVRFLEGQTIQFGYSWLELRLHWDGRLHVFEPDFKSMPTEFVDSASRSTVYIMQQKYTVESFDRHLELEIPSLRTTGIICNKIEPTSHLLMSRSEIEDGVSGWFVGCMDKHHDHNQASNLQRLSLYEIGLRKPEVVTFFGLPTSCYVILKDGLPIVTFDDHGELKIAPGSFLAAKIAAVRE